MKRAWIAGGAAIAVLIGAGAWQGLEVLRDGRAEAEAAPAPTYTQQGQTKAPQSSSRLLSREA